MSFTVILHIPNEASVAGEVEELPKPSDNIIVVTNPRQKDGKDLHYIDQGTVRVIWPPAGVNLMALPTRLTRT